MENDWEQVKDIFQAALERPAFEREQFIAEACRGNQSLSEEVHSLLDSFEENDSFFEKAAIGEVAEIIAGKEKRLIEGEKLGRYIVKHQLGAGGMGEVFLAEDAELKRLAAVKILSPVFSNENERIRRFVREAKSVSALNHPNILTIYEIGQHEGLHFIATEYIKGETLRAKLKREPLNLPAVLDITIQIATALNAAHEAKIIHRDIKPENVMIREDGLVKVLDFGLAKLLERKEEKENGRSREKQSSSHFQSSSAHLPFLPSTFLSATTPGLIMGTIAYMSPEQTRGRDIDERTDIWSLGVCLYEMLCGFTPFAGETASDVIAAIIKSEPPPLKRSVPKKLGVIIKKTLEKNAADRYQNTRELLNELKFLHQNLDAAAETEVFAKEETFGGGEADKLFIGDFPVVQATDENLFDTAPERIVEQSSPSGSTWKMRGFAAVAAAALLICCVAAFYYLPATYRQSSSFEKMRFTKLTSTGDVIGGQMAVSPDGKQTAYVIEENGKQSFWKKELAASGAVQLIPPAKLEYGGLRFSVDGKYIYYFAVQEDKVSGVYRIAAAGGEAEKLIDNVERSISFSPDGKRMSFIQKSTNLMTANADGSDLKLLATAQNDNRWNTTAWSPDNKTIVCTTFSSTDNYHHLVEVSIENGAQTRLETPPWTSIGAIEWLPDKSGLLISGRDLEAKLSQLWMIGYPDGQVRRITNDLNSYFGISLTADGKSIVSLQYERQSGIWLASSANSTPARQATFEKDKDEGLSGVALTSDGRIVFTMRVEVVPNIWTANADGSEKRPLTVNMRSNFSPAVSPDNRYIAFVSTRSGSSDIWRMDLDGGNPKQLTNVKENSNFPVFSPDGKWIVYSSLNAAKKTTVWKVSVEGGEPIQLTDFHSTRPTVSPDGKFIACYYGDPLETLQNRIAIVPFSGGNPTKLLDFPEVLKSPMVRWTADGKGLIYIGKEGQAENLWKQSLDGGSPEPLTNFRSEKIYRFDALGDNLIVARGTEVSDVIMISDYR